MNALNLTNRKPGISGFYRVRNEAELLEASVEAHLPHLDEIVVVYNNCTDETPAIARALAKKHPDKVKAYEYEPHVYPALSREHIITPARSVHSLVNYYNFALTKTTRTVAVKIDADHLPVLPAFKDAVARIRASRLLTMAYFYGVNLFREDGAYMVNERNPFTHGYDCGFFPVSEKTYFVHRKNCEALRLPWRMYFSRRSLGVLFYHLKGVKEDRGLNNLGTGAGARAQMKQIRRALVEPELIVWDDAARRYPRELSGIPDPNGALIVPR